MHKNEQWIKLAGMVLCESYIVCTIIMLLAGGEPDRLALMRQRYTDSAQCIFQVIQDWLKGGVQ